MALCSASRAHVDDDFVAWIGFVDPVKCPDRENKVSRVKQVHRVFQDICRDRGDVLEVTLNPICTIDAVLLHLRDFRFRVIPLQLYASVSYTHLRAHETPEHLVCRLLLEKKKK